jgi:hypothetical protein
MSRGVDTREDKPTAGFHTRRFRLAGSWSFSIHGLGQFHLYMRVKNLARMVAPQAWG